MKKFIRITPDDNVVVALKDLEKGEQLQVDGVTVTLLEKVDKGHKIAIVHINKGEHIVKYGMPIGHALEDVEPGSWIHTHNLKTNLSDLNTYSYLPKFHDFTVRLPEKKVNIYRRKNGDAGIRNELWIVPTVGCVNGMAQLMLDEFKSENNIDDIDGAYLFKHNYGCSQLGEDHENTKVILQDLVKHPNAGAVLVVGLGCENNQVSQFKETLGEFDSERTKFLIIQDVEDEVEEGKKLLKELYDLMKGDEREEGAISDLKIGLECGGSDGFSGITANPLLGEFSDYIINYGGTTVLTEVPEMFGAETLLMERCEDEETFEKTVSLVNDFKEYFIRHDQEIYENPSPGNKKGGITTLEDKSLGCTQKSGRSKVKGVLKYGEIIEEKGLNLLSAPGNDLVATTALGAAGCQMVLFTTGRGNPYGGFIPTVKISTNTELAQKKKRWIDFDAGKLVSTNTTMEDLLEEFVDYIIRVVNGEYVNNEKNNFREIAIFKSGVTL